MKKVQLIREFNVSAQTVFDYVTKSENLLKWWGPEGMTVPEHNLNLDRLGPWTSTMMNAQGGKHKVSGEVLNIDAPNSVEFTWGWHDDNDQRGNETTVRFDVAAKGENAATFTLTHSGFADDEIAKNHTIGWTSSLKKLEALQA